MKLFGKTFWPDPDFRMGMAASHPVAGSETLSGHDYQL
jgi:hypothetical protein